MHSDLSQILDVRIPKRFMPNIFSSQMQDNPDYYKLFNIEFTAQEKEIRKAYRQKSLQCHPDRKGDDPEAAKMFHLITTALETLLDPVKRKHHDDLILAKQQRETRFKEMDSKRQFTKSKLEERELQAKKLKSDDHDKLRMNEIKEKTKYQMKARQEMQKQSRAAANSALNMMEQAKMVISKASVQDCTVKIKIVGQQDEISIKNELSRYGPIDSVLMGKKKAIIVFKMVKSAFDACEDPSAVFKIEPLLKPEPEAFKYLRGDAVVGIDNGFKGKEYEEMTLNKLRDAS